MIITASRMAAIAALTVAAALVALPLRSSRRRLRLLSDESGAASAAPGAAPPNGSARVFLLILVSVRAWVPVAGAAVISGAAGWATAGPVAATVAIVYAVGAVGGLIRWARAQARHSARLLAMESVSNLAADLRAGVAVRPALDAVAAALAGAAQISDRVMASIALAEVTGAPLAEVLDRLDADLRATDRLRAVAAAQAAGARASAWLLAAMPAAGLAIGYAIGADPGRVLLHTPLGAACLFLAVLLQISGIAWAGRLSRIEVLA